MPHSLRIPLLLALWGTALAAFAQSRPNVLLVVVDDLNDYAFVDGHPESAVPNIARLADRGTRFNNAYCSSPLCAPSRFSFLSGKTPQYTGVLGNPKIDSFREVFTDAGGNGTVFTLPEILKDSGGYYTVGINKLFHNFFRPGYDNDFDSATANACLRRKSWSEMHLVPDAPPITPANDGLGSYNWGKVPDAQEPNLSDYRAMTRTLKFLEDYRDDVTPYCDRPFFLAVGLVRPHTPQFIPERYFPPDYLDDVTAEPFDLPYNEPYNAFPPNGFFLPPKPEPRYADYEALGPTGQALAREYLGRHQLFEQYGNTFSPLPLLDPAWDDSTRRAVLKDSKRANAAMAYWAAVRYIDAQLGRLVDFLDANPALRDSTIVVLVSDHGYALGEKSHWQKQALWETDIRVPFIVVDPRRPGGRVSRRTVSLLDLFPTLLELTGTPAPAFPDGTAYLDGLSIVPLLDDPEAPWERPVLSTVTVPATGVSTGGCFEHWSVRSERWHYIRYQTDAPGCDPAAAGIEEELYEIGPEREVDPFEWNNLAGDNAYRPVMDYLAQWLPGGERYGQRGWKIRLQTDALPCRLTRQDTLRLSVRLWDEQGVEHADGPGPLRVIYRVLPFGRKLVGPRQAVPLAVLDSATFAGLEAIDIQVALYHPSTGVLALDTRSLPVHGGRPPSSDFTLTVDGSFLRVDSLVVLGEPLRTWWTFGDGVRSDDYWQDGYDAYYESGPPQHQYLFPGEYELVHHLTYGTPPGPVCEVTETRAVSMPDSLFEGLPCPQPGLVRLEVQGTDGTALARWSPVFADDTYELRYRQTSPPDLPWTYRPSNVPTLLLDSLVTGQEYAFSVRAICDTNRTATDTSAWSYPFRQRVIRCDPPAGFAVDSLGATGVRLAWQEVPGVAAYELAWRETGGPFTNVLLDPGTAELALDGLHAGATHVAGLRSLCPQSFTQEPIPGAFGPPLGWTTPTARARATAGEEEAGSAFGLRPNPAGHEAWITGLAEGADWVLFDAAGHRRAAGRAAGPSVRLDLGGLPAGVYLLRVTDASGVRARRLLRRP